MRQQTRMRDAATTAARTVEATRGATPSEDKARAHLALDSGRRVLRIEAAAVAALGDRLEQSFPRAVELMLGCTGRIVVSGIGKSGHVASKIASTLARTGAPAFSCIPPKPATAIWE